MPEAFRCCVVDDAAIALASHADIELIVDSRLPSVDGTKREIHVAKLVRFRVSANNPRADGLAMGVRAVAAVIDELVRRDSCPTRVQARPVVVIFQMSPGRRTLLALLRWRDYGVRENVTIRYGL